MPLSETYTLSRPTGERVDVAELPILKDLLAQWRNKVEGEKEWYENARNAVQDLGDMSPTSRAMLSSSAYFKRDNADSSAYFEALTIYRKIEQIYEKETALMARVGEESTSTAPYKK